MFVPSTWKDTCGAGALCGLCYGTIDRGPSRVDDPRRQPRWSPQGRLELENAEKQLWQMLSKVFM